MATKTPKTVQKISVKIWRPMIGRLDEKMAQACLRRDAYLTKVIEVELERLDEQVSIPNSEAARNYVADRLDQLDRKLVSVALPPELTARINEICGRKRIVRDAFFNRLFFLLAAPPNVVEALLFHPEKRDEWRSRVWEERRNDGPFFQNGFYPMEPTIDPFWAIHTGMELDVDDAGLEEYLEPTSGKTIHVTRDLAGAAEPVDSVYTRVFDQKVRDKDLLGLSCFMPDHRVPGHSAEQKHRAKVDELFAELAAQS